MINIDDYYIYVDSYKCYIHRTPLKVIVNPILRFLQFWTKRPFVIASDTEFDKNGKPHFLNYCFARIKKMKVKNIDKYYVKIIQNGNVIQDQLYNIYEPLSMVFDEKDGFFYHKDYEEVSKMSYEDRCSVYPSRNYSIKTGDYYSVSVSLKIYLKMLSGKMPFPFKCNLKDRIDYDLLGINCTTKVDKEVIKFISSYKKKLSKA